MPCPLCWSFANGLLELKRWFEGDWVGERKGFWGAKLSGSVLKGARGGARSTRVSGKSGSRT